MDVLLIVIIAICAAAFIVFVIQRVVMAHRRRVATGREDLLGKTAVVRAVLDPEGMVLFKGELWTAVSEKGQVKPGEEVIITKVDGLKLYVTKKEKGGN